MSKTAKTFLVRRSCTRKSDNPDERGSHPLEFYRDHPAYVLLGDPGSGKTEAFKLEADESGGKYIKARDFATLEQGADYQDKTLFIDALDEMRADGNDGRTPLDKIRQHLQKTGRPRFRLSCREADWLGESDIDALMRVSPNGKVIALHLDSLADDDIIEILRHKTTACDAKTFVCKAGEHGLSELLRNPQTLHLLVDAVGDNEWPKTRKDIYEMACCKLVAEKNSEHRRAKNERHISPDKLLDAAGYLCAIHLLSGIAGFALDEGTTDDQHFDWNNLAIHDLPLLATLKTNLFQGDGEERLIPVHRSVAEYLGARFLSASIETHGLPIGRVVALMTGKDGGVVTDLRGLAAWLSVHCRAGRPVLIERDPLGVVLYGDVRNFPVADKHLVLAAMKNEAQRYPWFRSDDWSSAPFGALGTTDMLPAFKGILESPSRNEADQSLLDCVLDAIRHGEPMHTLADSLETIARDASYWAKIRSNAAHALMHIIPTDNSRLLKLAHDIHERTVADSDDEILGNLLHALYPSFIPPDQILQYLHLPKNSSLIGSYYMFWGYELPKVTADGDLPRLLDQLVHRHKDRNEMLQERPLNKMAGELLTRGLAAHGETITDERLYDWLGVGIDEYEHTRLDEAHEKRIVNWFTDRPSRYKAIIERSASVCIGQANIQYCMRRCTMRLYASPPPADMGIWYLHKATTAQPSELATYYFHQAFHVLKLEGGDQDLTLPTLELMESWVNTHPDFQKCLEPLVSCPINGWQQKQAFNELKHDAEQRKNKNELVSFYRQHLVAISDGSAPPTILYDVANAYRGLLEDAHGKTPHARLKDFFCDDEELVEAAYSGLHNVLNRNDLPTVGEIVDLELKDKMHYIRSPCLVGMDELYQSNPSGALQLDDAILSRLVAFRFTYDTGEDPAWVTALIQARPSLVAEVLLTYALPMLQAGKERVSGLYPLAYTNAYSEVARTALMPLLESFPLRAGNQQLKHALDPLLKAAIHYLDKTALASIVMRKLEIKDMRSTQRIYWLVCGLIVAPLTYTEKLLPCLGNSKVRRRHLAGFLHDWPRGFPFEALPEIAIALLIELLAPDCSAERPAGAGWVSPEMHTADLTRSFINALGGNPSEISSKELERLLVLPSLAHWHDVLRHALHTQRITRRTSTFHRLGVKEVCCTLANRQPANAADLAALTFDHLRVIARNIRDSSTNDYKQYWSYDKSNKKLDKTKPENDCRDALLSDLKERIGKLGVDAQREGNYADDKRADIRVSFGGADGFNVPVEIKKDSHRDLWCAIREQLILKYVRDPGAGGYGIYLVFWFGGKGMPRATDQKTINSAAELETQLRQTLTPEESHRIMVCVIDCALP